ncbi:Hypothetical predicted protein, partial [Marmota monax]
DAPSHQVALAFPQVLFAACELGLFDLLAEAPGPLDVAAISEGLGASPRGTELLLEACVPLRLLDVDTRGGTGELPSWGRARGPAATFASGSPWTAAPRPPGALKGLRLFSARVPPLRGTANAEPGPCGPLGADPEVCTSDLRHPPRVPVLLRVGRPPAAPPPGLRESPCPVPRVTGGALREPRGTGQLPLLGAGTRPSGLRYGKGAEQVALGPCAHCALTQRDPAPTAPSPRGLCALYALTQGDSARTAPSPRGTLRALRPPHGDSARSTPSPRGLCAHCALTQGDPARTAPSPRGLCAHCALPTGTLRALRHLCTLTQGDPARSAPSPRGTLRALRHLCTLTQGDPGAPCAQSALAERTGVRRPRRAARCPPPPAHPRPLLPAAPPAGLPRGVVWRSRAQRWGRHAAVTSTDGPVRELGAGPRLPHQPQPHGPARHAAVPGQHHLPLLGSPGRRREVRGPQPSPGWGRGWGDDPRGGAGAGGQQGSCPRWARVWWTRGPARGGLSLCPDAGPPESCTGEAVVSSAGGPAWPPTGQCVLHMGHRTGQQPVPEGLRGPRGGPVLGHLQ